MAKRRPGRRAWSKGALLVGVVSQLGGAGCSPSAGSGANDGKAGGSGGAAQGVEGGTPGPGGGSGGALLLGDAGGTVTLTITPATVTVTVDPGSGAPLPTTFTVTGAGTATPSFRVTNPALGSISSAGVFTPSGTVAGETDIEVTVGDDTTRAHVIVAIDHHQNGAPPDPGGPGGLGGVGGVGGEGSGGSVPDATVALLKGAPEADPSLTFLYPYDDTVFPLGMLPPLLQWTGAAAGPIEAVAIRLTTGAHYRYEGLFGVPPLLPGGQSLVRHPIPRDVWAAATASAAGSTLAVEVVVVAGGRALGPLRQSYRIALAPVKGTVYYQAYNTDFATNYAATTRSGKPMGGATLSIVIGAESPSLVAGRDSADHSGCRVCHSVSAYGDRMIVQHGEDYEASSTVDLKNGNTETTPYADGIFGWVGLSPDGTLGLTNTETVAGPASNRRPAGLYDMATGQALPATGLSNFATRIGLPAFSPDGRTVAFTFFDGASTPAVGPGNGRKLVAMDFDRTTFAFSNPRLLWEAPAADQRPAWTTFLPSSSGAVFQRRWEGGSGETFGTRGGARGELWWVDLASGQAAALARTNGISATGAAYLPRGPAHDADETLSYEPSISPVASGGYAWMVFVSRRAYGNVATSGPWESDPRDFDIEQNITTKKLWMAAIDLSPTPGQDPSHPAFYIPGQELRGVNSRPFFALEPCVSDRGTCSTGVDCCSGFCRDGYCGTPPVNECSRIDERCETTADCCDTGRARCLGGFCAIYLQ